MKIQFAKHLCMVVVLLLASACGDVNNPSDPFEVEKNAERDKQVRENMRTVQTAAEHYAADHGNINYPVQIDDMFKTYFPGGEEGRQVAPVGIVNPFTSVNEFPVIGKMDAKSAQDIRHTKRFAIGKGVIEYIPLEGGHGYAIVGGAHDDQVLMDDLHPDEVLVFSNR